MANEETRGLKGIIQRLQKRRGKTPKSKIESQAPAAEQVKRHWEDFVSLVTEHVGVRSRVKKELYTFSNSLW